MENLGVHLSQQLPPAQVAAVAQMAEELGYRRFFFSDHLSRDPFAVLAACALSTSRISLGTAVMPIFTRHPVAAAIAAATLDHISEGRFILGLGPSHREIIEGHLGIPWQQPLAHLREYIHIVRELHRGEAVRYQGKHYRVDYQLAFPPSRPVPLYLGPSRPRQFALAGELADGVILNWGHPEYLGRRLQELKAGARQAGRDPTAVEVGCSLWCQVTHSAQGTRQAREQFGDRMVFFLRMGTYRQRFADLGFGEEMGAIEAAQARGEPSRPLISDALLETVGIIGEADFCRARLEEYRRAGITLPLVIPLTSEDGDLEVIRRTLAALAR